MVPARSPARSWSVRCRRGGMALLLVAAFLASSQGHYSGVLAQPAALPADLAMVPADAVLVAQIRVADLWNGDLGKSLRKHGGKLLDEGIKEMEKKAGFTPGDVDRVTLAMSLPQGFMGEPAPLVLITTTKPYSREKILKALAPDAKQHQHQGKSYYATDKEKPGSGPAVAFVNDRLFLLADPPALRAALERKPGAEPKGPLAAALRKLATSKHHVLSITDVSSLLKEVPKDLPPQAEPFKPLLKAQLATQSLDLGKDVRVDLTLSFANPADAQAGAKALNAALDMVRPFIAQAVPEIERQVIKEVPELGKVIKTVVKALDNLKAQQAGTDVKVVVQIDVNAAELIGTTLIPAVQKVRDAANRMTSTNNLKQIALAMHNHESAYRQFPPHAIYSKDGKPLLSWRVTILPFIEEEGLYRQFKLDEPWDSVHNKKLLARMPKVYAAPDGRPTPGPYTTYYQVFTGANTLFEGPKGTRIQQIRDGTSNTLMVVEAGTAVPWTKPEDIAVDPKKPLPKLGGLFPNLPTFNVAFCDGSVRAISRQVKEEVLRALITSRGGEVVNPKDF